MSREYPNVPIFTLHHNAAPTAEMAISLLLAAAKQVIKIIKGHRLVFFCVAISSQILTKRPQRFVVNISLPVNNSVIGFMINQTNLSA